MFIHGNLFILADSPYNKLVRNRLSTEYSLRFSGSQCALPSSEKWAPIKSCKVKDKGQKHLALCVVDLQNYGECESYNVAIVVIHGGDKGQSKTFQIKQGMKVSQYGEI